MTLSSAQAELPPPRARRPHPGRARGRPRHLRPVRRRRQPRRLRALLLARRTRAGRQDDIYRDIFAHVATTIPTGGRFYPADDGLRPQHDPRRGRDPRGAARLRRLVRGADAHQFPGSFLPFGSEQVVRNAEPDFKLVSEISGRLDYIETIKQWRKRFAERSFRKTLMKARLVPKYLTSREFRLGVHLGRQLQQRLLRARAARPLPPDVREGLQTTRPGREAAHGVRVLRGAVVVVGLHLLAVELHLVGVPVADVEVVVR